MQHTQPGNKQTESAGNSNSLFDFDNGPKAGSVGDEDANFASPTSSQFVARDRQGRKTKQTNSVRQPKGLINERVAQLASQTQQETLEEALVDLYLSVKIRSNDEVSIFLPCSRTAISIILSMYQTDTFCLIDRRLQ